MKIIATILLAVVLLCVITASAFANPISDNGKAYSKVPTEGTPAMDGVGRAEGRITYPVDLK